MHSWVAIRSEQKGLTIWAAFCWLLQSRKRIVEMQTVNLVGTSFSPFSIDERVAQVLKAQFFQLKSDELLKSRTQTDS